MIHKHLGQKAWLLGLAFITACASQPVAQVDGDSGLAVDASSHVVNKPEQCRVLLSRSAAGQGIRLDSKNIRLLNWNIQKAENGAWSDDLSMMSEDMDLVLIQEASLKRELVKSVDDASHWSFAQGYTTVSKQTGVMTLSRTRPLVHCTFTDQEPWLRTPKATSITEFALSDSQETLVVVNIHAVNFSFGLDAFRQQIQRVDGILRDHSGPIIFSGDFNTWRDDRVLIVQQVAENLGMSELNFQQDNRITIFGQYLDHIFTRGLSSVDSATVEVESSDHNPMFAVFKI